MGRNISQVKSLDDHIATIRIVGSWCCWRLPGKLTSEGYSQFRSDGLHYLGHRAIYEHLIGPIPEGLTLDHLCRHTWCVHPNHVDPVTCQVNTLRGVGPTAWNARKTKCPNGHPYDTKNTFIDKNNRRHCRICSREAVRRYRQHR